MTENETEFNKEDLQDLLNKKLENLREIERIGKDSNYMKELGDIALIQLQLGRYIDSENNYLTCLKHFKKHKDRFGQAAVYGVLATLSFKKNDYLKSLEFYEKAYEIYKELKQVQEQIACSKGIGNSLINLKTDNNDINYIEVETKDIKEILTNTNRKIDLIRMDIEGHERELFNRLSDDIKAVLPARIFFEIHPVCIAIKFFVHLGH